MLARQKLGECVHVHHGLFSRVGVAVVKLDSIDAAVGQSSVPDDIPGQIRWLEQYLYPDFSVDELVEDWARFWRQSQGEEPSPSRRRAALAFFRGVREIHENLTATRH